MSSIKRPTVKAEVRSKKTVMITLEHADIEEILTKYLKRVYPEFRGFEKLWVESVSDQVLRVEVTASREIIK